MWNPSEIAEHFQHDFQQGLLLVREINLVEINYEDSVFIWCNRNKEWQSHNRRAGSVPTDHENKRS